MDEREGVPPHGGAPLPYPQAAGAAVPSVPSPGAESETSAGPAAPAVNPASRPESEPGLRPSGFEESYDTGRLQQLPTGQLLLVGRPGVPDQILAPVVEEPDDEEEVQRRVFSWIGAVAGAIGALASLFVGWMLPLSLAAIVFGVLGLRREEHGRTLAFVGIGTGITGLVFSAVWLGYYAIVYGALPA